MKLLEVNPMLLEDNSDAVAGRRSEGTSIGGECSCWIEIGRDVDSKGMQLLEGDW